MVVYTTVVFTTNMEIVAMIQNPRLLLAAIFVLAVFAAPRVSVAQPAQAAPTTGVLAILTVKPDIPRPELMKVLPDEVRATVQLHLQGKITQWYGRGDGKGVVFILNAGSVEEARKLVADLPLDKSGMATFEFMALTPLSPLRVLIGQ